MAWGGGGGGFQVSTVSYLNPSCIKLELGLGYANFPSRKGKHWSDVSL